MKSQRKKNLETITKTSTIIENVLGCKWTILVLEKIHSGTYRPGALSKTTPGLSAKVLNERLKKLLKYKLICRKIFNEIPPKVEYNITSLGKKVIKALEDLRKLEAELIKAERSLRQ